MVAPAHTFRARPDVARPDVARPDVARPDVAQSEVGQSDPGQSDPGQSDVGQSGANQSDVGQSGPGQSGVGHSGPGQSSRPERTARQRWMSTLAKASPARLALLVPDLPALTILRSPEVGAVMVRGRTGATGAPFNLGEMTVTRCSVRLEGGAVGHAWVQGRDKAHATRAAAVDALMQTDAATRLRAQVLDPLDADAAAATAVRAAKAAATRVEFFTMVRGEDA